MRFRLVAVAGCLAAAGCAGDLPAVSGSAQDTSGETLTTGPTTAAADTSPASAALDTTTGATAAVVTGGAAGCWNAPATGTGGPVALADITAPAGLVDPLLGMRGHAAAWGEVDGDGHPDLLVGTFANGPADVYQVRGADGPAPDRLLLGSGAAFSLDEAFPAEAGIRTSGATFADLDADGDLDLTLSRNAPLNGDPSPPSAVFRNDAGTLVQAAMFLPGAGARSIGVLDYDHDGLLDLFVVTDRFGDGDSALLHNDGAFSFTDTTTAAGLPGDLRGLGVSVVDLTADGWPDVFVAGMNRLFVADGAGGFREANGDVFVWESFGDEDDVAGVATADLNRDGLPDLVVGQHYNSTLQGARVPVRVYVHRGVEDGLPRFEDVTEAAGMPGLATKAPHVEVVDFDADGWPDILTSASAADGALPAVFRNVGPDEDGVPRLEAPPGLGNTQYWVTGGTADADRDGRLDVFVAEWDPGLPSLLLRNESTAGHWLSVELAGPGRGVGAVATVYEAGRVGEAPAMLGTREVVASVGYGGGSLPAVYFGLGAVTAVDVRVVAGGTVVFEGPLDVDTHHMLGGPCPA